MKLILEEYSRVSPNLKVGFESTGHYGKNLKAFLTKNSIDAAEINPLLIKRFSNVLSLRRNKTDKADALVIANYLTQLDNQAYQHHFSKERDELKTLTRYREGLVRDRSKQLVKITNILNMIFPEYKAFCLNRLKGVWLYILKKFKNVERIRKLTNDEIVQLHNMSRRIPSSKFVKLKELALNSIGNSDRTQEFLLRDVIQSFEYIDKRISDIEWRIKLILDEISTPIRSIPGLDLVSVATLIGEFGDFSNFNNADKCIAYAGLECSRSQSGTMDFKGRMVKHGSGHIRYVLMNVIKTVCLHCPTFAAFYNKKRGEGKAYRVCLSHCAKRLIRVIYHLEVTGQAFNQELLR